MVWVGGRLIKDKLAIRVNFASVTTHVYSIQGVILLQTFPYHLAGRQREIVIAQVNVQKEFILL